MELRQLGTTDLTLSVLGLGTWAMAGAGWEYSWGSQADSDSRATIRRAVNEGINWIDTAAVYGLGHAEEIVGRASSDLPRSMWPLVFTKCSLVWDEHGRIPQSLNADSLERELEASLQRLRVETIDLYQVHWPMFPPGERSPELEEAWSTLARFQRAGKVRHLGVSNFDWRAQRRAEFQEPRLSKILEVVEQLRAIGAPRTLVRRRGDRVEAARSRGHRSHRRRAASRPNRWLHGGHRFPAEPGRVGGD